MDEPCSALDPIATLKIEELIEELKQRYTIVIVTHNMQQAARVADTTAFMLDGELVELGADRQDLHQPRRRAHGGVRHREVRLTAWPSDARQHFQRGARRARGRRRSAASTWSSSSSTGRSRRSSTRTSSSPRSSSPTTTASTAATSRSTRGSSRCWPCQAPVAGDLRLRGGAAARHQAHRAHGRPVREHRQAHAALRPRAAGPRPR